MAKREWLRPLFFSVIALVSACADISTHPGESYSGHDKAWLYGLNYWNMSGRLAISAPQDSWTANIDWHHFPDSEKLKLSGPLGQGAVAVQLTDSYVTIDRGDGRVQSSNEPEEFIKEQLGMFVPIHSLRFWAIGAPEPQQNFQKTQSGFVQYGWLIDYREMQNVGGRALPHKLAISKDRIKLKLVVEQWDLTKTNVN